MAEYNDSGRTSRTSPATRRQQVPSLISRSGARSSSPTYTPTSPAVRPQTTSRASVSPIVRPQSVPSLISRASAPTTSRTSSRTSLSSYGGGGGGGSYGGATQPSASYGSSGTGTVSSFAAPAGGGGGDFGSLSVPEPIQEGPKPWEALTAADQENYLAGDGTFVAQKAALQRQLEDEEASADRESNDFGQEILRTLRNMGFDGAQFKADDAADKYAVEGGNFNAENRLGAFGQAFGNQENDFAARGMLDSSGYDRGFSDLRNSFDQQKGDVMDSFTTFMNNAMGRRKEARNTNVSDMGRAKADAIARRAATLGLI